MNSKSSAALIGFFLTAVALPAASQEYPQAQNLIRQSQRALWGDTSEGVYTMTVIAPDGEKRLKLSISAKGEEETSVRVISPEDTRSRLTQRRGADITETFSAGAPPVKIASSFLPLAWRGSDFTYEDMLCENIEAENYDAVHVGEDRLGQEDVYVLELTPKQNRPTASGPRRVWLKKSDGLPLKKEFFSPGGTLLRVLVYSKFKNVSGRVLPAAREMISMTQQGRRRTILEIQTHNHEGTPRTLSPRQKRP